MDDTPDLTGVNKIRAAFLARCVSVDLEVDPATARVFAFAAMRAGDDAGFTYKRGPLDAALDRLEAHCRSSDHLIGHNILRHDLPHLAAQRPHLARLSQSAIDTLWLNPLAFPRNPYHHLVKHYQDGRLQAGHVNDPEADARLVLTVLDNQIAAFAKLAAHTPDALIAYHYLTTRGEAAGGIDAVFRHIRSAPTPGTGAAENAIQRWTCPAFVESV